MRVYSLWETDQPRKGRRLSLITLPAARPQRYWRQFLPWENCIQFVEPRATSLKIALGCNADTPEATRDFDSAVADLTAARLLVRVVALNNDYAVPPGSNEREDQARMDRWLPPGLKFSADSKRLRWIRGLRFASPTRNFEIPPRDAVVWKGAACYQELLCTLNREGALARWLDNGELWIFCRSNVPA